MNSEKSVLVTANKTLTAADSGIVQRVRGGLTITLPATALGLRFIIENAGGALAAGPVGATAGSGYAVTVNPQAADGVTGNGLTAAVNKDVVNTAATALVGDRLELLGTGTAGVTAYVVTGVRGTWAREA